MLSLRFALPLILLFLVCGCLLSLILHRLRLCGLVAVVLALHALPRIVLPPQRASEQENDNAQRRAQRIHRTISPLCNVQTWWQFCPRPEVVHTLREVSFSVTV